MGSGQVATAGERTSDLVVLMGGAGGSFADNSTALSAPSFCVAAAIRDFGCASMRGGDLKSPAGTSDVAEVAAAAQGSMVALLGEVGETTIAAANACCKRTSISV